METVKNCGKCNGDLREYADGFYSCDVCRCVFQEMQRADGPGLILVEVGLFAAKAALVSLAIAGAAFVAMVAR